jgi:hypothetical protein
MSSRSISFADGVDVPVPSSPAPAPAAEPATVRGGERRRGERRSGERRRGRPRLLSNPSELTVRLDGSLHDDLAMLASHLDKIAVGALARALLLIAVDALKAQLFVSGKSEPS